MTITLKQLRRMGACEEQVALFKATFGEEVVLTEAICKEHGAKFDITWLARHILKGAKGEEYEAKRASIDEEYRAKRAPIYEEYCAKRVPIYEEYRAKCAPIDEEYEAKRAMAFWGVVK